jgi:hypothetical protein
MCVQLLDIFISSKPRAASVLHSLNGCHSLLQRLLLEAQHMPTAPPKGLSDAAYLGIHHSLVLSLLSIAQTMLDSFQNSRGGADLAVYIRGAALSESLSLVFAKHRIKEVEAGGVEVVRRNERGGVNEQMYAMSTHPLLAGALVLLDLVISSDPAPPGR